jgi:hypothetical protein
MVGQLMDGGGAELIGMDNEEGLRMDGECASLRREGVVRISAEELMVE